MLANLLNPIAIASYLVAYLPVTLEGSRIRLILYKFHDVHPAILLRRVDLSVNAVP